MGRKNNQFNIGWFSPGSGKLRGPAQKTVMNIFQLETFPKAGGICMKLKTVQAYDIGQRCL